MDKQKLIARWIEPNPYRAGPANVRIKEYPVPVWALMSYWRAVDQDVSRVARDDGIPQEAVLAALAYYESNQAAIESRLPTSAA